MRQGDVGDGGVQRLHDRRQHDRDGDQPRDGWLWRPCRRSPAHGRVSPAVAIRRRSSARAWRSTLNNARRWPVSISTTALMPARKRRRRPARRLDLHAHRDALHHLHPVAAGVLRRQHAELRAGRRADAVDHGGEVCARIGVDGDRRLLARLHIGEVGLLQVGLDPGVIVADEAERRRAGIDDSRRAATYRPG